MATERVWDRVDFRGQVTYDVLLMERTQLRKAAMLFLSVTYKLPTK